MLKTINYDGIANTYDDRYKSAYKPEGIASKLLDLVKAIRAEKILEVACGTGHWLKIMQVEAQVYGIDLSLGMLQTANEQEGSYSLINGDIESLPFSNNRFNMIYCVNALHHFHDPFMFIKNSHKLLKQDGVLSVIGMNPHAEKDQWFIYDYFPGTYETGN